MASQDVQSHQDPSEPSRSHRDDEPSQDGHAAFEKAKTAEILQACKNHDIQALKELAITQGGFLSDSNRSQACEYSFACNKARTSANLCQGPILLGLGNPSDSSIIHNASEKKGPPAKVDIDEAQPRPQPWQDLPHHKDEDQVRLDVNRSFVYYPKGKFSEPFRYASRLLPLAAYMPKRGSGFYEKHPPACLVIQVTTFVLPD